MMLYMIVTTDKYELPVAVTDSVKELAQIAGVTTASMYTMLSKEGMYKRTKYKRIEVEDD